jgi:hypothetical protein
MPSFGNHLHEIRLRRVDLFPSAILRCVLRIAFVQCIAIFYRRAW